MMTPERRRSRRFPWALALALAAAAARPARADFNDHSIGTAGSEFLSIDVGPRGIAMGGAYSSVTDDAYSMYWNPAGLSRVPRDSLVATHNEYLAGIRFQYLAYAHRLTDTGVIAGAVRYMDIGDITNTDINGNTIGSFRPRNYVYEMGWGQSILDLTDAERDISMGVSARYFHSDLIAQADGVAGDFGIQAHYADAYRPYHFSFVVQNFGRGQKFDQVRDNLPTTGRLGASILPIPALVLALDAVMPIANQPYGAAGAEYAIDAPNKTTLFLRGGYNSLNTFNGPNGFRGAAFGMGLKFGDFTFDYAFSPFGVLGDVHRFSLSWNLPAKHSRRFRDR